MHTKLMTPRALYRRLVPLPPDLPASRGTLLLRIERTVWLAVVAMIVLVSVVNAAIDAMPHDQLIETVWHTLTVVLPSIVSTLLILRFSFARSIAHAHEQDMLRQSAERFERQFRAMPVPAYCWRWRGDDFYLEDYNTAAERITEGAVSRIANMRLEDFYQGRPEVVADFHACLEERRTVTRETAYRSRATGVERTLEVTYIFVPPDQVVVHTVDHTERVARERADRERIRLEGAQLAARTAAHEINNALSPVTGFSELLALEPVIAREPRLMEYTRFILQGAMDAAAKANRLQRIIRLEEDTRISTGTAPVLDVARSTDGSDEGTPEGTTATTLQGG